MGYSTQFQGQFDLDKPLDDATYQLMKDLAENRHEDNTAPGYYCQWVPTSDRLHIEWDMNEKFYDYVEWLEYIVNKVLIPNGYVLNGEVSWQGEDSDDRGLIIVKANKVTTKIGRTTYAPARKRVKLTKLQQLASIDARIAKLQAQKKALLKVA